MLVGGIAYTDGAGAAIAVEIGAEVFGDPGLAEDIVEDAELGVGEAGGVKEPLGEGMRLAPVAEAEEGADGEGGIAEPAVAVVPVTHAADGLGEGGGGSGDDGAGRGVGQELED